MIKKLKEYHDLLNQSIFRGKKLQSNIRGIKYIGIFVFMVAFAITVLNFHEGKNVTGVTTAAIALAGLITFISSEFFQSRKPALFAMFSVCILTFTYYAVKGTNEGFAILWTLLVPLAFMYFASVKYGIYLSVYYFIMSVILFYTPLRGYMADYYTQTFMNRFPILYMLNTLVNSLAMIQYHVNSLHQFEYDEKLQSEVEVQTKKAEERLLRVQQMSIQMVETLANAIDAKDKYTNGHSFRVSEYSVAIARAMGWKKEDIETLRFEAMLHDVGKIGVPDVVLNKPGRLTDNEFVVIQSHTTIGGDILANTTTMPGAEAVARYHHERYDGMGYPAKLKGDEIPLHARIVAIADAFDAMHSDRIYRKRLSREVIRQELIKGRGTQFDPEILDIFLKLYDNHQILSKDAIIDIKAVEKRNAFENKLRNSLQECLAPEEFSVEKLSAYKVKLEQLYHQHFSMLHIKVCALEQSQETDVKLENVMKAMDYAIGKIVENKGVDVICPPCHIIIVMYDEQQTSDLLQKIYADYYKLTDSTSFELTDVKIS